MIHTQQLVGSSRSGIAGLWGIKQLLGSSKDLVLVLCCGNSFWDGCHRCPQPWQALLTCELQQNSHITCG